MQDLDFDELDRAVNSAISNKPVLPVPPRPVGSLPTIPVMAPTSAAPRPSTGRFMDVVHPSSDMRTALVMPERVSSQVATVSKDQMPMVQTSTTDDDADIDQISSDITYDMNQTADKPLDSPFISGAKVEKRPLNALSSEQSNTAPFQPIAPTLNPDKPKTISEDGAVVIDTPLPAELQNDLLSIESKEMAQSEEPPIVPAVMIAQPLVVVPPVATPVIVPKPAQTVATSIPQQYKEQPNSGEKTNGAIYDVNSYHKAMVSPTKKKSSSMWVLWIAILMIVSVGAGVAVYYFVLPQL